MEPRKYPQKTFRMNDEIVKRLAVVSIETGMNESDVIRGLVNKAYFDKTLQQMLRKFYDRERIERAGIDTTSYNARSENDKKNGSLGTSEPRNVDRHPVSGQEDDTVSDEELQNTLQRLRNRRNHQTEEPPEETVSNEEVEQALKDLFPEHYQ